MKITSARGDPVGAVPPRANAGERFQFNVSYLGIVGARAAVFVEQPSPASRVFTADIENTALLRFILRIRNRFQAVVDAPTGATTHTRLWQDENGRKRFREESFFEDRVVAVERGNRGERTRHVSVPMRPMDPLSVLFWLRSQRLHDGDEVRAPVFSNNHVFEARVRVAGHERLDALGRSWRAARLITSFYHDGKRVDSVHGTLWLSEDEQRLPLRVVAETTYGKVAMALSRADP